MRKINLILLFLAPFAAFSQVILTGTVKDSKGSIAFANIVLQDSSQKNVKGSVTDQHGGFSISLAPGKYTLTVSYIGYKKWTKDIVAAADLNLDSIVLDPDIKDLNQVVIKGRKNLIEFKPDRLIFNVESSVSASGGDALSAIASAPGVVVQNNNISMLGKGSVRVMINGRMVELSDDDLTSLLKSISASNIKSIEVITNPPANYEAGGDGGLININLKKGLANSWKNSTVLSYDQNTYAAYGLHNNFLYNKNKIRFALSAGGKLGDTKVIQTLNTFYPSGPWNLRYDGRQKADNASGLAALDYDISSRTSIGIQYLGNYNNSGSGDQTNIKMYDTKSTFDSLLYNNGNRAINSHSHTLNMHLVSRLDTLNRSISFDLDYFTYNSKTDNNFLARTFLPDKELIDTNLAARNISDQNIDNYSAKVDVEHPLKFINLSYGAKVSFTRSRANILYYNTIPEVPVLDPKQSNGFKYNEDNQAIYVSGDKNISSKLTLQLGLRLENTQTKGYSVTLNQSNTNNYLKLFPTAYFQYKHNDDNSFLLNYGRRINRPAFGLLNPFRSYINSNSYSEGNPFLKPSFSDNLDFTYVYKGKLRTNAFFNITSAGYGPIFTSDSVTKTLIISRRNYLKEYYFGIGENYTANLTDWWQTQNSLYIMGSDSKFSTGLNATPKNSAEFYFSTDNTFSLSKSTKFEIDYTYISSYKRGLYSFGYLSGLNLSARQSLLKDKMQLSFLINDLFNTAYLKDYTSTINGIKQVYSENNGSRFFRVSLTYSFGNNKINVRQRDFGNEDEKSRTGN
ncbi:MAG TPA: TonB-dependent receptor [Puia sp.]|nr:TonB-dependent receptor [Puia sp.]